MADARQYEAVVIGVSAGGLAALDAILPRFDRNILAVILVVQHLSPDSDSYLPLHYDKRSQVRVKEAEDKESLEAGTVYFAPPNYHLLVEYERTLALSAEERVNYSRPSIDVLFETAAEAYGKSLIGVILTGANYDGAAGLRKVKEFGGLTIVQSPETAEADIMPRAAIEAVDVDHILPLDVIGDFLNALVMGEKE